VETPEHALLECVNNAEVNAFHSQFNSEIEKIDKDLLNHRQVDIIHSTRNLIASREAINVLAGLTNKVLVLVL
jgi:hypothetical protein